MTRSLTVIGRDNGNKGYEGVLVYHLDVESTDHDTVLAAFIEQRATDIEEMDEHERGLIEILFAFEGDLLPVEDWRG